MLQTRVWGVGVRERLKSKESPGAPAFGSFASLFSIVPSVLPHLAPRNPGPLPSVPSSVHGPFVLF